MARTAPAPNIPPIPGMCPGMVVLAGGGDGGGGGAGSGKGGKGKKGAGTSHDEKDPNGDGKNGKGSDPNAACKGGGCGNPHTSAGKGDPVDAVTGAVFTDPVIDLELPGPLPFEFSRQYSSNAKGRDVGVGFGWTHSFSWRIEVGRRSVFVHDASGGTHEFTTVPPIAGSVIGPNGWVLKREVWGYALDIDDGTWRVFSAPSDARQKIWLLTAVDDANNNRIALTYDDARLVEITDSAGRRIVFGQTPHGRIASVTVIADPARGPHEFARYLYDQDGNLVTASDAMGHSVRYSYAQHRLIEYVDRVGTRYHFRYDRSGRCIETWGESAAGGIDASILASAPKLLADSSTRARGFYHVRLRFFPAGYSEVANSLHVERFDGTPKGRINRSVTGGGANTIQYDAAGHVVGVTNSRGAITSFVRDARGRLLESTDPVGRTLKATLDTYGNPLELIDADGNTRRFTYDHFGRPESEQDAAGGVTTYGRDSRGLITEVVHPTGGRSAYSYDAQGNLIEIRDRNGGVWKRRYDDLGRPVADVDPFGNETLFSWDPRGDLIAVQNPNGGTRYFEYDADQRMTAEADAMGRRVVMTYGAHGELHTFQDQNGHRLEFRYDREVQAREIIDENGDTYTMTYDARGNVVEERTFDGRTVRFTYDGSDNVVLYQLNSGQRVSMEYDLADQLIKKILPDGAEEIFAYSGRGDLVSITAGDRVLKFERDPEGRIIREVQQLGDDAQVVETKYDVEGAVVERRSSLGFAEAIHRDGAGRAVHRKLGRDVFEHGYDAADREVWRQLSSGARLESKYDELGKLATRRVVGRRPDGAPSVNAERSSGRDLSGRLTRILDSRLGNVDLELSALGELLSVIPDGAQARVYSWDPTSNLRESGPNAPVRTYSSGGVLHRRGDTYFDWNSDGQLVRRTERRDAIAGGDRVTEYEWGSNGLLARVSRNDGLTVEYVYDSVGRRLAKTVSKSSNDAAPRVVRASRFVWDGDVLLHEMLTDSERAGDPVVSVRSFAHEDDSWTPLAQSEASPEGVGDSSWLTFFNDDVGTPRHLVAADGSIAADVDLDEWGRARGPSATSIRFPGQYADEETGLVYNRYRYYDPEIGRFISADPLDIEGGANLYLAPMDPFSMCDELGLFTKDTKQRALKRARGKSSDGRLRCENPECQTTLVKPKKSKRGVKPRQNEWQFDHKNPKDKGGKDNYRNCQVLCRKCNRRKSNKRGKGWQKPPGKK